MMRYETENIEPLELFFYFLFSTDERISVIIELERIWKEAADAYLKVLSHIMFEGTEDNHEKYRSG
jgi:hypothetical protein